MAYSFGFLVFANIYSHTLKGMQTSSAGREYDEVVHCGGMCFGSDSTVHPV